MKNGGTWFFHLEDRYFHLSLPLFSFSFSSFYIFLSQFLFSHLCFSTALPMWYPFFYINNLRLIVRFTLSIFHFLFALLSIPNLLSFLPSPYLFHLCYLTPMSSSLFSLSDYLPLSNYPLPPSSSSPFLPSLSINIAHLNCVCQLLWPTKKFNFASSHFHRTTKLSC